MKKVYMVCDYADEKAKKLGALDIGIEFLGNCHGRILHEDGTLISGYHSSTIEWLRKDLKTQLDKNEEYEIIDLIGQEVPERFKLVR